MTDTPEWALEGAKKYLEKQDKWAQEQAQEIIGDRCCCQSGFGAICRDCIARRGCAAALVAAAERGMKDWVAQWVKKGDRAVAYAEGRDARLEEAHGCVCPNCGEPAVRVVALDRALRGGKEGK